MNWGGLRRFFFLSLRDYFFCRCVRGRESIGVCKQVKSLGDNGIQSEFCFACWLPQDPCRRHITGHRQKKSDSCLVVSVHSCCLYARPVSLVMACVVSCVGRKRLRTRVQLPRALVWLAGLIYHSNSPFALWKRYLKLVSMQIISDCTTPDLLLLVRGKNAVLKRALPLVLDPLNFVIGAQHVVDHVIVTVVTIIQLIL